MIVQLSADNEEFPDPEIALHDPNGLLAIGGDLSPKRLMAAYRAGIFPWFSPDDPILWWSPNPRGVFKAGQIHQSRSLKRFLKSCRYTCTINHDFSAVIQQCAKLRKHREGTWISPAMIQAYTSLHRHGYAHSVEVWDNKLLVGGLYGVVVGKIFCGESMFHVADNASKVALLALDSHLRQDGLRLIDCQLPSPHLASLGAIEMPRERFLHQLAMAKQHPIKDALLQPQRIHCPFIGN